MAENLIAENLMAGEFNGGASVSCLVDEDDTDLVIEVAGQFVARMGKMAIAELYQHGEIAVGIGDKEAAEIWFEIARAAEEIFGRSTPVPKL